MLSTVISWIISSKFGRACAAASAALIAIALVLWRVFAAGKASQKAAEDKTSLDNLRNRSDTDDKIASKDATSRRAMLSEWVRGK